MSEGLLSRVRRLVSGSLNGLVDAAEAAAPETVMRQSIREVEVAIEELRAGLGVALANRHHAEKRLAESTRRLDELADKLRVAIAEKRDDLSEAVIARQLDLEAQAPVLQAALAEASAEAKETESYIAALQARKREMESDLAQFIASRDARPAVAGTAGETDAAAGAASTERRVARAEGAFSRVLQGQTGLAATSAGDRETAAKLAELEKVERANRIRERLAAAKAKA